MPAIIEIFYNTVARLSSLAIKAVVYLQAHQEYSEISHSDSGPRASVGALHSGCSPRKVSGRDIFGRLEEWAW